MKQMIVWLLVLTALAAAQPQEVTLARVNVEGLALTPESMVRYTAGLTAGQTITPGDVSFSRAVKRLWDLGLFEDIQIRLDEETPDGIAITIVVKENPVLSQVRFKGNKKLKDDKLKEEIDLNSGQRIKPNTLKEATEKIKDVYAEDGYLLAEVTAELMEPEEGSVVSEKVRAIAKDILFTIKENKKVKIRNIIFEGNEAFSDFRLRRVLKETKQQRWYLFWRSYFDEKKFEEDKASLLSFYRNRGYRDVAVLQDSLYNDEDRRHMNIRFRIYEGSQYKFRSFTWEGNTLFSDEELATRLHIKPGDIYDEEDFNLAVFDRVQGLYMDRGYIYSQIDPQIMPVGDDSLDVHFAITENHKVYVRNIYISGNTKTRENVIRREMKLYPGDVFNREKLIRSQREIWILNYFSNVVPDVLPVDEDEVDLEVSVEEKSSDKANANIGFTGEYGMMGGGGLEFTNFRGLGQRLMLSFNVGTQYNFYSSAKPSKYHSFSLSFTDPMVYDTPNLIGASLFYTFRGASTQYYYPLDFTVLGGSLTWGRRFRWPDDFFRGNWAFQIAEKNYNGTARDIDFYLGYAETDDSTTAKSMGVSLRQIISRDSRDRPEFTTRGSRMVWETTLSGGILGGNEDFHKHVLSMEWFTPAVSKFVLMSSVKFGTIQLLGNQNDSRSIIPFDERFVMGGNGIPYGNMLRGYPDNSIGPQTVSGGPLGGNNMLKITTEIRFPFSENPVVYGLAFADLGNVWSNNDLTEPFALNRYDSFSLKRAAGVGVRFFMPMIGMLGFDMGYGFDDISGNNKPEGWTYTITFGQQF
ncbi:MAG: outer membrane protein assembly factor BamA [Fidelibacterota bacterium]